MTTTNNEAFWPEFKALAEAGKCQDIINTVQKLPTPKEQVSLLRFTVRGLMFRDWANKSLNPIIQLGDLAIATALNCGDTEEANVVCYNMSANLADCWNDGFTRNPEHFKKGLQYADRALEFRKQLKKGPGPFALAYWARGIHQYSLGDLSFAEASFNESLKSAQENAKAENKPVSISKETPFSILIAFGYLAIAQIAQGKKAAEKMLTDVILAFEEMKGLSEDAKADAEIGLDQLRYVHSKISQ
jgi:hypothetical protein